MSDLQRSLLVGLCLCLYLLADGAAASSNTTSTSAPSNNNNTSGNATNVTDVQVTTFTSTDTVAPTSTTGAPTPAPTPAPPTPVPPTPVPPTPVPTGGSWTDVPSTMAPVLSTDAPTTTSAPTTTPAPPVCDASPFYCTATAAPQASCFLRTQAYIASLSCRCVGEEVRLPVVSIGASSQTFSLLFTSDLRLTATVYHAWCPTGSDPTWNTASITWTITTPAGIKVSPTGSILTGPSLFVPAGRLPINTKYTITVAAIVSKTAVKVTGFGNVTVSSVAPTPVISIVGGNRVASANVPLRIALDIEDAFLQQNAVKWSCCQVQDALSTTCLQFCNPPLDALSLFTSATLSLTPPGGYFTPAMMRIFATYSNIVTSISVQIVNSTVPQPIIFMPQAGYRRADSAISIGASWSSVPYSTTVQWLINGTAPGRNIATASDDGTSLTILAGSYNPGTVLLISVALLQGSTTVGTSSDYLVIESLPTTGTCVITSTDTQPLGGTSTLQMAVSGWQATSSFPTLALRVGFIDDAGVTQIISASETPIDATGRASTTFTAPLVSSFITAQQRSAPLTFTAQIIDSDRKLLVGRTTCTVTVYSFALTSGLPDVANAIVAKLTSSSSSSATADVLPNARNLVVIAASMQNATQVTLTNVALNSLITSLTQSPVNTLSNSVRLGTLRLAQGLLSTFSSNSTVLAQAVSVRTSTQSSWFALLSRFFRAEAATGNAAPPFATSTAGLYNSLISSFVPTAASTGQVDVSAMLSSDPNAASTLLACVTAIPFAAVDASSTWQGFAALVGIATTAAPLSVTPFDIASWTSGTASAISASKAYVYTALPPLGALSTQFVATTAAANSVLSLDSSLILLRVSLSVVNVTLPNNLGVLLRDQLAMPSITTNGQLAGSYFIVSDTLAFINVTTDADDFQSVFASGSSIGTIRFDQWSSIVSTAALKRPDLAGNQTQLVQQIQCQQVRDGALLQTTTTVVASASISCSKVVPNAAYALWIFRPASLDVVSVVTTTPAPTSAPPVVTVIQVQASSDNAMQSLTIVLSTVGSLVLLALIGVAVLLVFKIRGQKEQQEAERENRTKLLEFHEVKNPSTLDEIPSNRPRASVRDPSDNSSFLRTDVSDLVSPIRRSELGNESIARSDFFIKPVSFAVPSPLPPRVFIDEELQFVPRKRPGAVVNVENDPTPWL